MFDGTAESATELILAEGSAGGIKVAARVEDRVAKKFEGVAVKCITSRTRDDGDHASIVVTIFRIEVVGEDAKFLDGIKVRNNGSSSIHVFLHVDSINHKTVGRLPLPINA